MHKEIDLSSRYYTAEASVWVIGGILVFSNYFGIASGQALPILNITINNTQHFHRILAIILLAAALYMVVEWKLSPSKAHSAPWRKARPTVTGLWSIISLWIAYPLIAHDTSFASISPAWYLAFLVVGIAIGMITSTSCISALVVRSLEESKRLRLPRVPVAAKAQLISSIPILLILIGIYYLMYYFSPYEIHDVACVIVIVAFIFMMIDGWSSLVFAHDKNGRRIAYVKRLASLKAIFEGHDYSYEIGSQREVVAKEAGISLESNPKDVQKAMRQKFTTSLDEVSQSFHIEQIGNAHFESYPKDGKPENRTSDNFGVRIVGTTEEGSIVRFLFSSNFHDPKRREVKVPASVLEEYAEEYIRNHFDLDTAELFKRANIYATNKAVIEVIIEEEGPALHRLVIYGLVDLIQEMLEHKKTDVNEKAEAGWTPLLYAAAQGYPRIVRMLLEAGANPDIGNVHGITPLMYGAHYGNLEICKILVEFEAKIDMQDYYGFTALIMASKHGHTEVVEFLLNAGANPRIKNHENKSALDFSYEGHHGHIAKLLRSTEKKLDSRHEDPGTTPSL